nr:unnamed protein product [Callosobruchus analis]
MIYCKAVKFLGVYLDSSLSWKHHIRELTTKLSSSLFLIRRVAEFANLGVLKSTYYGHFHSKISYGLIFWGNSTESIKVFKMQKYAIRLISKKTQRESCRPLFRELQILPLPGLYIYQSLVFVKNHLNEYITNNSRHEYQTRHGENLLGPQHRLTLTQKSYITMAIKFFNVIPATLKHLPVTIFKKKVKRLLLEISPYNNNEFFLSKIEI